MSTGSFKRNVCAQLARAGKALSSFGSGTAGRYEITW